MASIERTAYPRFKSSLSLKEFHNLYDPTVEELDFTLTHARGADQQLALLTLLKSHQHLGYLPTFDEIPLQIRNYVCEQLSLPLETGRVGREVTPYSQSIRTYHSLTTYGLTFVFTHGR